MPLMIGNTKIKKVNVVKNGATTLRLYWWRSST